MTNTKPNDLPREAVYTVQEAAAYLKVSTKSIRRLIERGLLIKSKALHKILITGESVETFMTRTS